MIDQRVYTICEEVGVRIVDGRSYPGVRETRAVETMDKILSHHGEDHFRMVMITIAETENNAGQIDKYLLWAVSDLVEACRAIVETQTSEWLECFDRAPVGQLQYIARNMRKQRYVLAGMILERVVRVFGPNAAQGDLFDDRRRQA